MSNPPPLWAGSPRTQGTSVVQTDPHTASAAHLRAGSPRTQGTSVAPWWGRVSNPPPLRAGSPRSQRSSPAGWKPAHPGHIGSTNRSARASAAYLRAGSLHAQGISSTMVGAGLKPAPTTGWKPAQPVQLTCGLEARAPRASIVQTDPRTASAAHLRAGSPRTQGTSVVQTDPRAASAAHLRAGSPRTQGTSVAPWWGRV